MKYLLLGGGALGIVFLGVVAYFFYLQASSLTESELANEIRRELPRGSSQGELLEFLSQKGADVDPVPDQAGEHFFLEHQGVPPDTPVVDGLIRNTGRALLGRIHMHVYFLLQENGTLDRFFVDEVIDGL